MEPLPVVPINYYTPYPMGPRLPGIAKAVAIIGIIFGSLGAVGSFKSILQPLLGGQDPATKAMTSTTPLLVWYWLSSLLGVAMVIALLVGSFAVLRSKELGRKLLIVYAVVALIVGIANVFMTSIVIQPLIEEQILPKLSVGARQIFVTVFNLMLYGGFVLGLIWMVSILLVMTRPRVKSYFAIVASGEAPLSPYQPPTAGGVP